MVSRLSAAEEFTFKASLPRRMRSDIFVGFSVAETIDCRLKICSEKDEAKMTKAKRINKQLNRTRDERHHTSRSIDTPSHMSLLRNNHVMEQQCGPAYACHLHLDVQLWVER